MDIETVKAFAKGGSVVGFVTMVLYLIVDRVFSEPVYTFLGSENVFLVTLAVLAVLMTVILSSALTKKTLKETPVPTPSAPVVNYRDRSTHNGDNRF